ncbi:PQ-loop repeat-containing protein 1 [Aphelenchoides fujianensis]|nr:PQ-loop repeat-containing protein 1 [Aphelenchoides fujianensis]
MIRSPTAGLRSSRSPVGLLLVALLVLSASSAAALEAPQSDQPANSTLRALPAPPAAPLDVQPAAPLDEREGPKQKKNIPEIVQEARTLKTTPDRTTASPPPTPPPSTRRPSTERPAGSVEAADLDVRKPAKPNDRTGGRPSEQPAAVPLLTKKEVGNRTEEAAEEEVIPALTTEEFRALQQANATSAPPTAPTASAPPPPTPKVVRDDSKDADEPTAATPEPPPPPPPPSNRTASGPKSSEAALAGAENNSSDQHERADGQKMLLIEQHAINLIPLQDLLQAMLFALAATFMVVGGAIPYVFQYVEIHRRKSALGFSLLVCLALCVANILRILFWFGKRFETVLLCQSVVMIGCMLLMLEISVRMNKRMLPPSQLKSIWKGHLISDFWKWNDLTSFIAVLGLFTLVASIITFLFIRFPIYVEALGMVALLVEACLGLPQLIRNFQRKSTQGMSVNMVLAWLLGDVGKTVYFVVRKNPAQFWICGGLQITIDVLILGQVYFFGRGNARVPTYQPRDSEEKTTA